MIDIIGPLYDPHPTDPEGEPTLLPGFHVNVTTDYLAEHPELAAFVVEPSPLRRVWAGDDPDNPIVTVPLRFDDEAEGRTYFPEAEHGDV
ncbi:hypothetical protein [Brevundimonas albigilva]|uniref:Uncharacterized protein n=1 Tax=Brevundimonas albigilva TaxID=1312364 RepID=A0ABY4SMG2_9CAUL|nr:hypothetical protein [Brevundimonas albigilva]URI15917.1 hypothetical protein M8231_02690 [Brevundimonas albigilva]